MIPGHDRDPWALTQPLEEHQKRRPRWRPSYEPNHVPWGHRIIYGLISLTWVAWALIGLLSGHMFFLVSRGGGLHFSGLSALLFSACVLACALACLAIIVDHYDRRDNEEAHRKFRHRLWLGGGVLFVLACMAAYTDYGRALSGSGRDMSLLTTPMLQEMLTSSWLVRQVSPSFEALHGWFIGTTLWCIGGVVILRLLGLLKRDVTPRPVTAVILLYVFVLPALATFSLALLAYLGQGGGLLKAGLEEEDVRAKAALISSMLTVMAGLGLMLIFAAAALLVRAWRQLRSQPSADFG